MRPSTSWPSGSPPRAERLRADLDVFLDGLRAAGLVVDAEPGPAGGGATHGVSVVAVIAAHNRRERTVACLRSLFAAVPDGMRLSVVLVDDGSTDGTRAAVDALDLPVTIVTGPGDWYWSKSMSVGEAVAEGVDPDVILWLNDDVDVDPSALARLQRHLVDLPDRILVGSMWGPRQAGPSFGGFRWADRRDLVRIQKVPPGPEPVDVEGFHGNFVAVPRSARRRIGAIDGGWPHHYADLDYALRAEAAGVPVTLMPGFYGVCAPEGASWLDRSALRRQRLADVLGRKGWPIAAHVRFHRRYATGRWPAAVAAFYVSTTTGTLMAGRDLAHTVLLPSGSDEGRTGAATFPAAWHPTPAVDLMRVGPPRDGGYVVARRALTAAEALVSGGLGDHWEFEDAFAAMRPVPVTVFDATVGPRAWLRQPGTLLRYRRLVSRPGVVHRRQNLGSRAPALPMADALALHPGAQVFVKLDIEGGEYECLDALVAERDRITGLVMEMHAVDAYEGRVTAFLEQFDSHVLVFVRANNAALADSRGRPRLLEMSWVRRDLFVPGEPVQAQQLDYSNDPLRAPAGVLFAG